MIVYQCHKSVSPDHAIKISVTTLQAVTWAGAARRIPRRRNSAERQYAQYCALGQGCKDPKPLRLTSVY